MSAAAISYVTWAIYGGLLGLILSPFVQEDPRWSATDIAYEDNPRERQAARVARSCSPRRPRRSRLVEFAGRRVR
jgi:hypothetical protein